MTKISIYNIDDNVQGNDKWIGSDAQNQNRTKNFTPSKLAKYFNNNNIIDIGASIRYMYQTLDIGETREQGTISFETEIGPQVNFSAITTFLIAKNTLKGNTVTEYLDFLIDSKVILSKANDINTFGYYKITSIEPYIPNPNFLVVVVEFLDGNGFIYEDLDYLISLVDKAADAIPTSWGTIIGDITNQTDLIEYLGDEYYPLLSNPAGYLTVDTVPIPSLQNVVDVNKSADRVRFYYDQFNDGVFAPLATYFVDVKPSLVDDRIYMYGNFTSYDGTTINRLLRLNGDGTLDTGFSVGTGLNADPFSSSSLLPTSDDKLFVSGFFTSYNGVSSNRIVKLNGDGSIDTGFVTGSGFNNWTGQMALNSSSQLCIVGRATSYNGISQNRFFRLNPDGTNDATLVIGTGFSDNIPIGIKVDASDNFYITGYFTVYNGTASSGIIKLFADGSVDTSFNIGTGILNPNNNVNYTLLLSDGTILLFGALVGFNGTTVGRVVKLNADGSINSTFATNVGTGFNLAVGSTCYETPSNKIILTGSFTSFNGVATDSSIILNLDGTIHKVFPTSNLYRSYLVQGERIIGVNSSAGGYYTTEVLDTYPVNVKELTFDEVSGKAEYKIGGLDTVAQEEIMPRRLIEQMITESSPAVPTQTSDLINDGEDGIHKYITLLDLPSNLILYPTTVASDVVGYVKLVTDIHDPEYNTVPVDVSTGSITTTAQLISSLITVPDLINGNPGVFNITTIGNIRKTAGSGTAEFYFQVYKRDSLGTETLIGVSNPTIPTSSAVYAEFSATAIWDDGIFTDTDRVVLKFYANRISGGSNPTYEFQFGGLTPVRTLVPIPLSVVPVSGVASVTGTTVDNTDPLNPIVNVPTLQQVTDSGASTTNDIYASSINSLDGVADQLASFNNTGYYIINTTSLDSSNYLLDKIQNNFIDYPLPTGATSQIATILDIPAPITIDATPTDGSANAVSSNGVFDALATKFTLPALTSGSVLFSNGTTIAQDNANFFWDDTNNRLNIGGITSNTARLGIKAQGALSTDIALRVRNSADTADILTVTGDSNVNIPNNAVRTTFIDNGLILSNNAEPVNYSSSTSPSILFIGRQKGGGSSLESKARMAFSPSFSAVAGGAFVLETWNGTSYVNLLSLNSNGSFQLPISLTTSTISFVGAGAAAIIGTSRFQFAPGGPITGNTGNVSAIVGINASYINASLDRGDSQIRLHPTINQTATALGIYRGLWVNPTLTSITANSNWRSIEWDNNTGYGLYGSGTAINYLQGNLGVGTTLPTAKLHITAQGALSTDIAFRVRNSADSANLIDIRGNGNVGIGATSDAGFRLDVSGTARITSTIQASGFLTNVANGIGITSPANAIRISTNDNGANIIANNTPYFTFGNNATAINRTSGTGKWFELASFVSFAPTSGTCTMDWLSVQPTINQTGGANGITRGLYINPTLTSAFDFRAIETTVGNVILNSTSGNTLIGTTTDNGGKLQIKAPGALSTDIAFRVRNSADSANLMTIAGNGTSYFSNNISLANFASIISGSNTILFQTGRTIHYASFNTINSQYGFTFDSGGGNNTLTSGTTGRFSVSAVFAPTSGTAVYNTFLLDTTINQTGGANGIARGLYINPTLTSAFDFRAIEVSSGGVYINTTSVQSSAILQADSTTKGFLPPRMTNAQRLAIASPAVGLIVYCTDATEGLWENTSAGWVNLNAIDATPTDGSTNAVSSNGVFDALGSLFEKNILKDNYFWYTPSSVYNSAGLGYSTNSTGQTFTASGGGVGTKAMTLFSSTAVAGTIAFKRRNDAWQFQGLIMKLTQKIQFQTNISGQRFFHGLTKNNQFSAPTNVDQTTLTNIVGVCQLSTSTNMHVIHNDASGTATTIDLGVNYPCNDTQYNYFIEIQQNALNYVVTVERVTVATGISISTSNTLTTNIMDYTTGIIQICTWITNNATASIASYLDGGGIGKFNN